MLYTQNTFMYRDILELTGDAFEARELLEGALSSGDSQSNNWRMISADQIDQVMQDELECDEYMLGCFNAWFLADILEIDTDAVERIQASECFEALGQLVISGNKLKALQEAYRDADGYGHHFAHYDGEEHEVGDFYLFRVN